MRFVEWDSMRLRVSGAKINEIAQGMLGPQAAMIEKLQLRFLPNLLRVEGTIRKFIAVPFAIDIPQLVAKGHEVRVPLGAASAFGAIPIPRFLFGLVKAHLPTIVGFAEPATLIFDVGAQLPEFLDVAIERIDIIEGGLIVTLGAGGADLPPGIEIG